MQERIPAKLFRRFLAIFSLKLILFFLSAQILLRSKSGSYVRPSGPRTLLS